MSGAGDDAFRIRLGRIYAPDGLKEFRSFAGKVRRAANGFSRGRGRVRSRSKAQYFTRRVIVKFHVVKMTGQGAKRQAAHIDYIQRDAAAKDNDLGHVYDQKEAQIDADDFITRTEDDPHQFRIIVSPEDSRQLESLTEFTRGLMSDMEDTLGTKLDWIAANHYDTATPHTHIVLSGRQEDGKALRIPRDYISKGMRLQAERLATIELGPVTQREAAIRLARQVTQERFTALDRGLLKIGQDSLVDLSQRPPQGTEWTRRLDIARLKHLSTLGLAHAVDKRSWKLDPEMQKTMRGMGERGDILKAYHKALNAAELEPKRSFNSPIYDSDLHGQTLTGKVLSFGVSDDVNDKSFIIIDSLDHGPLYVKTGAHQNIEDVSKNNVIEIQSKPALPRSSDKVIDAIAEKNGGRYSAALHLAHDKSARPAFIEAHIRRLEALRRIGITTRNKDGSWTIPGNYLDKVMEIERARNRSNPVTAKILTDRSILYSVDVIGRTWLDNELLKVETYNGAGFASEFEQAKQARRAFLVSKGILENEQVGINNTHLDELEKRDIRSAGEKLSAEIGKPFTEAPNDGRISGKYVKVIDRPSGRYALVERAKDFTLVPWRDVLEKRRGLEISGQIRNGQVSWQFAKNRGLDIS